MCVASCWRGNKIVNDKVIEAVRLIKEVYAESCVGGNAHAVVDDWNYSTEDIWWQLGYNAGREDTSEAVDKCLNHLLMLTEEERDSALYFEDTNEEMKEPDEQRN